MTNAAKTGLTLVIVVIVIIVGLVWYMRGPKNSQVNNLSIPVTPAGDNMASGTVMSDPRDTSNEAITNDMTSIDTEMKGLDADSANADESLKTN